MRPAMLPVDWAFCPAEVGVSDQAGSHLLTIAAGAVRAFEALRARDVG